MAQSVIAAQLYTLREYTQTPADIARTLRKVKALGYDAVQLSALAPIAAADLKQLSRRGGPGGVRHACQLRAIAR